MAAAEVGEFVGTGRIVEAVGSRFDEAGLARALEHVSCSSHGKAENNISGLKFTERVDSE